MFHDVLSDVAQAPAQVSFAVHCRFTFGDIPAATYAHFVAVKSCRQKVFAVLPFMAKVCDVIYGIEQLQSLYIDEKSPIRFKEQQYIH